MIQHFSHRVSRWRIVRTAGITLGLSCLGPLACGNLGGPPDLPSGIQDPSTFNTPAGALQMYQTVIAMFGDAQLQAIVGTGTLADEFQSSTPYRFDGPMNQLDLRSMSEKQLLSGVGTGASNITNIYGGWHGVRRQVAQTLGVMRKYAPELPTALQGHLYALVGFAEVGLADFFCSGIPLSTLDFEKDFTYSKGLPTAEVYHHAIALLDTAIQLAADSARIVHLVYVGKARALSALGEFEAAAAMADSVPDKFQYTIPIRIPKNRYPFGLVTVPDREGGNGLPFRSDNDPRVEFFTARLDPYAVTDQYLPAKYPFDVSRVLVIADWIEARLIRAEADLQRGRIHAWLDTLNALRAHAITPGMPVLEDPGTSEGRIDLLFKERAYWLFATARRQGDLRRLVRQYGRSQHNVFPNGLYMTSGSPYGQDVNAPIPPEERQNPLFTGCIDRDA